MIRGAACGDRADQAEFADRYGEMIRKTLGARWQRTPLLEFVEDAAQQVFVECFREDGVLANADPQRGKGFRGYLFGAVRNIARTFERQRMRSREMQPATDLDMSELAIDEVSCSAIFDREWGRMVLRDAADRQLERARTRGPRAVLRHRLLQARFREDQSIRSIAERWRVDPETLHHEYARARKEFRRALMDVILDLQAETEDVEQECNRLLALFAAR